jgi:EthD domain
MTIKLMICGRRRAGQTRRDHQKHMKEVHGPLVLNNIATDPDNAPRVYVQNHAIDTTFTQGEPSPLAFTLGFDFVTEVWFPDMASAKASRETDYYRETLMPDEPKMVDTANVLGLPYTETEIQSATTTDNVIKLFIVMAKDAVVPAETIAAARASLPETLGYSRNVALVPGPIGAIDVFRFADLEAAYTFADAYQQHVAAPAGAQQAAMVIAKEFLFYPVR